MALYDISFYSLYTPVLLDLYCVTLLQISRHEAQIEHYFYAYLRVLCIACDERRPGDPIVFLHWLIITSRIQCVVPKVNPRTALGTQTETV